MSYKANASKRDEAIAAEVNDERAQLMCAAVGCPNRWTVSGDYGRACSAHYWSPPEEWPRITEAILRAQTDRALAAGAKPPAPKVAAPLSPEQRARALAALRGFAARVRLGSTPGAQP